jgi:tetratricopeptide (TPR) repeat protein
MPTASLDQINRRIFECRKKGRYGEALEIYKEKVHLSFNPQKVLANEYLVGNILHCLRKVGRPESGIDFLFQYLGFTFSDAVPRTLLNEAGWCFYDWFKNFKKDDQGRDQDCKTMEDSINLLQQIKSSEDYLLFSRLFFELCRVFEPKKEGVHEGFLSFIQKLGPEMFSDQPNELPASNYKSGRPIFFSSDREKYYMQLTKILYASGLIEACLAKCQLALEEGRNISRSSRFWIARRLALCLQQLGRNEEAAKKMLEIARKKKDWFLWVELGEMYLLAGQEGQALLTWGRAFFSQGQTAYKAGFYGRMAQWFYLRVMPGPALWHLELAFDARKQQGWKIPSELQWLSQQPGMAVNENNLKETFEKCAVFWEKQIQEQAKDEDISEMETWHEGTITAVLNEGLNGDGFITTREGKSIYFRTRKLKGPIEGMRLGARVKVKAAERQYKGRQVVNALQVFFV